MNIIEQLVFGFEHVLPSIGIPKEAITVQIDPEIDKFIHFGDSPLSICVDDECISLTFASYYPGVSYHPDGNGTSPDMDIRDIYKWPLTADIKKVVSYTAKMIAEEKLHTAIQDLEIALTYQKEKEINIKNGIEKVSTRHGDYIKKI